MNCTVFNLLQCHFLIRPVAIMRQMRQLPRVFSNFLFFGTENSEKIWDFRHLGLATRLSSDPGYGPVYIQTDINCCVGYN